MVFGLGPVVRYELITTARRARYYLARVAYGLSLLVVLSSDFANFEGRYEGGGTPEQVRLFAEGAFIRFAGAQGAALLCLIPALAAGVIADEHQRKTLHYLLASRLSSAEIVLGKLAARLVHVANFIALGIPVVCLLALYGGLNPANVLYVYAGTFSTVVGVAGVSIFVSVLARRPRDAIIVAYGLEAIWLFLPPSIASSARYMEGPLFWVGPVNGWLLYSNPVFVWGQATGVTFVWAGGVPRLLPVWFAGEFLWIFCWMVTAQVGAGLFLTALAILGLRPLRGSSWPGAEPKKGWWARLLARARAVESARAAAPLTKNRILRTPFDRRPCGDHPMLWKERHARMGGSLSWLSSRPMTLFWSVLLGCYLLDVASPLISEVLAGKRPDATGHGVNEALRAASVALAFVGMLGVAAASAVSLTGEREQDTWISLATTLLTPAEVVRAKLLGAIWSARWIGLALLFTWAVGVVLGALHPLGACAALMLVVLTAGAVAAVGVFASAFARNSTRALVGTFVALMVGTAFGGWHMLLWELLVPLRAAAPEWRFGYEPISAPPQTSSLLWNFLELACACTVGIACFVIGASRRVKVRWGDSSQ